MEHTLPLITGTRYFKSDNIIALRFDNLHDAQAWHSFLSENDFMLSCPVDNGLDVLRITFPEFGIVRSITILSVGVLKKQLSNRNVRFITTYIEEEDGSASTIEPLLALKQSNWAELN